MAYDPQRNRARAQPAADETAPVDLVLSGTTEPDHQPADPAVDADRAAHADHGDHGDHGDHADHADHGDHADYGDHADHDHGHEHGPACDHDHEHGPDLRLILVAGAATLGAVVLALRHRRRTARS